MHPSEGEHRSAEQSYWRKSSAIAWVAVIVSLLASGLSFQALNETRRQADAADDANRPWLRITGLQLSYFSIKEDRISMLVHADIENVGHTPAKDVQVVLAGLYDGSFAVDGQRCAKSKPQKPEVINEHMMFPAETRDIAAGLEWGIKKRYDDMPILFGCVYYSENRDSGKRHYSSFAYYLAMKARVQGEPGYPIAFTELRDVDATKMVAEGDDAGFYSE